MISFEPCIFCGGNIIKMRYPSGRVGIECAICWKKYVFPIPTRERCQICHEVSPIGFEVPYEIWKIVVHPNWQNSIVCLRCFISRADEKMIKWEVGIKLYPVSLRSQLEFRNLIKKDK